MYMQRKLKKNLAMKMTKNHKLKFFLFIRKLLHVLRRMLPPNSALERNKERGTPKPCVCSTEIFQKSPVNGGINIR